MAMIPGLFCDSDSKASPEFLGKPATPSYCWSVGWLACITDQCTTATKHFLCSELQGLLEWAQYCKLDGNVTSSCYSCHQPPEEFQ